MVSKLRKAFDWTLGLILIAIGVVGFFVPIMQGWIFVLAGLGVLSSHSRWAQAALDRLKAAGRSLRDKVRHRP